MADMVDSALVIMAKAPVPGQVKTRLCPPMTQEAAAEFYACMLGDKISQAGMVSDARVFLALPESVSDEDCRKLARGCGCLLQRGKDLGERLRGCAEACLSMGFRRVLLVDSDTPTLPVSYFSNALDALDASERRVVLGPTTDGGYYLIGLSEFCDNVFEDIPWSTSEVFSRTLERAREASVPISLLPEWYDVDTGEDVQRLMAELADPAAASLAPKTSAWLRVHVETRRAEGARSPRKTVTDSHASRDIV